MPRAQFAVVLVIWQLVNAWPAAGQEGKSNPVLHGGISETRLRADCSFEGVRAENALLTECKSNATKARNEAIQAAHEIRVTKDPQCGGSAACLQRNRSEESRTVASLHEKLRYALDGCKKAHQEYLEDCRQQRQRGSDGTPAKPALGGGHDPRGGSDAKSGATAATSESPVQAPPK